MVICVLKMLSVGYILYVEKILSVFAALAFLAFALLLVLFISGIFCFTAIYLFVPILEILRKFLNTNEGKHTQIVCLRLA